MWGGLSEPQASDISPHVRRWFITKYDAWIECEICVDSMQHVNSEVLSIWLIFRPQPPNKRTLYEKTKAVCAPSYVVPALRRTLDGWISPAFCGTESRFWGRFPLSATFPFCQLFTLIGRSVSRLRSVHLRCYDRQDKSNGMWMERYETELWQQYESVLIRNSRPKHTQAHLQNVTIPCCQKPVRLDQQCSTCLQHHTARWPMVSLNRNKARHPAGCSEADISS